MPSKALRRSVSWFQFRGFQAPEQRECWAGLNCDSDIARRDATPVRHKDGLLELGHTARNTRPNGAEWDFEDVRNLFIGKVLQIKEAERRSVWFLDLSEKLKHARCVKRANRFRRDGGQIFMSVDQLDMWKTHRPFADVQELPVQGGKQPRFDLAAISQLVAFGCPDIECLLGKIARVGLRVRQA